MTTIRPVSGCTPNWMFDPPVSTPMARITCRAMSRMFWYSTSVQGLRRRDRDAVAGVHAHRVDVLDAADDDDVVGLVAHHLQLELLPAEHRLLDQHLVRRASTTAPARPAPPAPRCCRRCRRRVPPSVNDGRRIKESRAPARSASTSSRPCATPDLGHVDADRLHAVLELLPVLGLLDRVELRADELRPVLREDALLRELHREVQRRLPAHRRQHRVGPLGCEDALGRPRP